MDSVTLRKILRSLQSGRIDLDEAMEAVKHLPFEDLAFAKIDHHRQVRQGIPEVVFAEGKREEDVVSIGRAIFRRSGRLLVTKASAAIHSKLRIESAVFHPVSRVIAAGAERQRRGLILVVAAGTSDIPVAEEAAVTASFLGSRVETAYDVGVAGIHRLLSVKKSLFAARVVVVVAGMEGALPSVVGGLVDKPIVAVPTSVGYGTSLRGLTALFAMLNSCVPGIGVMNIDNGFGAGCLAHRINALGR